MSRCRPYIPLGCDQQGRELPTLSRSMLAAEQNAGTCDTCPGELGLPEETFQRDAEIVEVYRLLSRWALVLTAVLLGIHFLAHALEALK